MKNPEESLTGGKTLRILRNPYRETGRAGAIIDLLDAYARDPMGGGRGLEAVVRQRLIRELERRRHVTTLLAEAADEPVGVLVAVEGFSTFAARSLVNVHDVAVRADWRGRGIGSALLKECERLAREKGACKVTLEVLSGNEGARRLYRRLGYGPYQLTEATGTAEFWEKPLCDKGKQEKAAKPIVS